MKGLFRINILTYHFVVAAAQFGSAQAKPSPMYEYTYGGTAVQIQEMAGAAIGSIVWEASVVLSR